MMMKNVRILVAAAACILLGMPLLAEGPVPVIQGMGAEAGAFAGGFRKDRRRRIGE